MNIQEYITTTTPKAKVDSAISERWQTRVVAHGWHLRGRDGANAYINQYLVGGKPPKIAAFAVCAAAQGYDEFAAAMWEEAYHRQFGKRERVGVTQAVSAPEVVIPLPVVRESFGRSPHLPERISRAEAEKFLHDDDWGVEEKMDGRHLLLRSRQGVVTGGSKGGLQARVPLTIADTLKPFGDIETDGEDVYGDYHAFNLLSVGTTDYTRLTKAEAHDALVALPNSAALRVVPLIKGTAAKLAYVKEIEARGGEGFIVTRLSARYGEEGSMFKVQFRAQNAFIVGGRRNEEKSSVEVFVLREDGSRRSMGFVTVKANQTFPKPDEIVEVKYLYAYRGDGKLHQPELLSPRDDATHADCQEGKLRFKAE